MSPLDVRLDGTNCQKLLDPSKIFFLTKQSIGMLLLLQLDSPLSQAGSPGIVSTSSSQPLYEFSHLILPSYHLRFDPGPIPGRLLKLERSGLCCRMIVVELTRGSPKMKPPTPPTDHQVSVGTISLIAVTALIIIVVAKSF